MSRLSTSGTTPSGVAYTVRKPTRQEISFMRILYDRIIRLVSDEKGETYTRIGDIETYCLISSCVDYEGHFETREGQEYRIPKPEAPDEAHHGAFAQFMNSFEDDGECIQRDYKALKRSIADPHLLPDDELTAEEIADPN